MIWVSAFLYQTLFLKECYAVLQNRIVPEWERVFSCLYLLQCLIALFIHGSFTLRTFEFKNGYKTFSWVLQYHICSACSGFTIRFDYNAFHAEKQSCKESMIENFVVIIETNTVTEKTAQFICNGFCITTPYCLEKFRSVLFEQFVFEPRNNRF